MPLADTFTPLEAAPETTVPFTIAVAAPGPVNTETPATCPAVPMVTRAFAPMVLLS